MQTSGGIKQVGWKSTSPFLDKFGDGLADTVWPSMVEVVGELGFVGPEGEVVGCTFFFAIFARW